MALTKAVEEIIAEDRTGLLAKHLSWERVALRDVASVLNGYPFDSAYFNHVSGVPLIRIRDVVSGSTKTFFSAAFDEQFLVNRGDLIVGMDGDFNSARWCSAPGLLNQRVCKISSHDHLYSGKLLEYALPGYLAAINAATSSITVKHLSSRTIEDIALPLPPRNEQERIVERLEEVLSDLDDGIAELKAAQEKLVRYRRSLLKAAVDGTLTASWREVQPQQPGEPKETGGQLLERILTERRTRWEAKQLAKFAEQGKIPSKGWQAKYPEPVQLDATTLPELPDGWVWTALDQVTSMVRNGLSRKPSTEPIGYPILRINAVRPMSVNLEEVRYLELEKREAVEYILEEGDLLATRYNGSVDLLGVIGQVKNVKVPTVHPDKLIRIKPVLTITLGAWIEICAAIGESRRHVVSRVKTTAGQTGISGEDIKKMPIPLAPIVEQSSAISTLEVALFEIARQDKAIACSLNQSAAQRQNILKAAFSGQLVPQDPNDEPAAVLLERIRAERAAAGTGGGKRGRKTRALS